MLVFKCVTDWVLGLCKVELLIAAACQKHMVTAAVAASAAAGCTCLVLRFRISVAKHDADWAVFDSGIGPSVVM
jgi:hypothetical protein